MSPPCTRRTAAVAALAALAALAVVPARGALAQAEGPIVVGGKNFTEQLLLAEMTAELLRARGLEVEKKDGLASALLRQAQEGGEVDLYWEYTGTALVVYNKVEERLSPEATYERVKELDAERGLVWLQPSGANNTYAIAMGAEAAAEHGLKTVGDFGRMVEEGEAPKLATDGEFARRDDGLVGLQGAYGFRLPRTSLVLMDPGLTYEALRQGRVDAAVVQSTDGRVQAFDFAILEDDKGFFPSYALTPVVRRETLDARPELAGVLGELSGRLNDGVMRKLNAAVDVDGRPVEEVAAAFLKEQGLAG